MAHRPDWARPSNRLAAAGAVPGLVRNKVMRCRLGAPRQDPGASGVRAEREAPDSAPARVARDRMGKLARRDSGGAAAAVVGEAVAGGLGERLPVVVADRAGMAAKAPTACS